jgi:phosphoribosylglycinamide formyltransferase-1
MDAMAAWPDASEPGPANPWPSPQKAEPALEQEPPDGSATALRWPQAWPTGLVPLRLGVMASGNGSNFEALVAACRQGSLAAEVVLLVVNNPDCHARQRAERLGIPCRLLDHRVLRDRQELDGAVAAVFREVGVDLVVMAGWMRIVTPALIGTFAERLINIHPSLLPSFRGIDAVGQALAAGVRLSGCTAHLVVEDVDAGPILAQAAVPVLPGDDATRLAERIRRQEHRILPLAVALAAARLAGDGAQGSS